MLRFAAFSRAHPYVFGLSVAGGLMTMGIEGVIVGPIVLCAFVTAIELSRMILKPPDTLIDSYENVT